MLQLEVIYGKDAGKCMRFRQNVICLGSSDGNDFQLNDSEINRHHGRIECDHESGVYVFYDLQSARGTRVRSTSIDVLLYSHQLEQSVVLSGECMLFVGQSMVRCSYVPTPMSEQRDVSCIQTYPLHAHKVEDSLELLSFLLETSTALSTKTTHESMMAHLTLALMQYLPQAAHIIIWRYDEFRDAFTHLYERSRQNEFAPVHIDENDFREAVKTQSAWLYGPDKTQDHGCAVLIPLSTANRQLGVIVVESVETDGIDEDAVGVLIRVAEVAVNAFERTFLNADLSTVFDGFIRSIIAVMDARDPASAGHSMRVAKYALITAQAIQSSQIPAFKNITFSKHNLDELRFASLLHDIGKVVLRREILLKATKLTPPELQHLLERITLFEAWFSTQSATELGDKYRASQQFDLYREMVTRVVQAQARASEADKQLIEEMCNTFIPFCPDLPLLKPAERESLLIERGTLNREERQEIQRHALISWQYLSQITWPQRWANVPIYVLQHHEKLNGTGYPYGISGDQIHLQSRIITVCDIFDALTGGDRLYKTRHSFGDAAWILHEDAKKGALDPDIVELFINKVIPQISDHDLAD